MVDGVVGYLNHAVRDVVVDYEVSVEHVIIPNPSATVNNVKARAIIISQENAMTFVVLVSMIFIILAQICIATVGTSR